MEPGYHLAEFEERFAQHLKTKKTGIRIKQKFIKIQDTDSDGSSQSDVSLQAKKSKQKSQVTEEVKNKKQYLFTKEQALELNKKGEAVNNDSSAKLIEHLKANNDYDHFFTQACDISEAVKCGVRKPGEMFASQLDQALKYLDKNGFQPEDFKCWPIFKNQLIKRRLVNFTKQIKKRNDLMTEGA